MGGLRRVIVCWCIVFSNQDTLSSQASVGFRVEQKTDATDCNRPHCLPGCWGWPQTMAAHGRARGLSNFLICLSDRMNPFSKACYEGCFFPIVSSKACTNMPLDLWFLARISMPCILRKFNCIESWEILSNLHKNNFINWNSVFTRLTGVLAFILPDREIACMAVSCTLLQTL